MKAMGLFHCLGQNNCKGYVSNESEEFVGSHLMSKLEAYEQEDGWFFDDMDSSEFPYAEEYDTITELMEANGL